MNVRDLRIIHTNLIAAMQDGRDDDAYAWTRLLCRQLRPMTAKPAILAQSYSMGAQKLAAVETATGTEGWLYAA